MKRYNRMPPKEFKRFGIVCDRKPPTKKHRPAIWEGMLGAVYAYDGRQIVYFDYDWDAAVAFSGASETRDPRFAKKAKRLNYTGLPDEPRVGKFVLWILDEEK